MSLPRLAYKGRRLRRLIVVSVLSVMVVVAFGASFALAQESRTFLPWFTFGNGAAQISSPDNIMRGVVGQNAVGRTVSDDDLDDQFEIILGFQTSALVGRDAFAELITQLALTPIPTPTPVPTDTPTPEPTAEPTEVPPTAEATSETTVTPEPVQETPTPSQATSTPRPTEVPPTAVPTSTPVPQPTLSPTPLVVVVTSVPEPTATSTATPEATATAFVLVVTSVPEPEPSATPEPPPSGGICSAPSTHGPLPLDIGWLMLLLAPLALWRFGIKS